MSLVRGLGLILLFAVMWGVLAGLSMSALRGLHEFSEPANSFILGVGIGLPETLLVFWMLDATLNRRKPEADKQLGLNAKPGSVQSR